jgi:23S rRNA (cytosine1962-C5)-methyltransferase
LPLYVEAAFDNPPKIIQLKEQDIVFDVPIWEGQKTGWFFDQKQNRSLLGKYVKDSRVLDVFSYIGAWGISAAVFGAREVLCVDSSKSAIELATKNAENNNVQNIVRTLNLDAFAALKQLNKNKEIFDTIIIDPPAFIKKQKDIKEGCNAYLRIHMLALQLLKSHGILFTTSCSQHFTKEMFLEILQKAATTCKRELLILEQLHQSLDHPIHPSIPETEYLKGFVIMAK